MMVENTSMSELREWATLLLVVGGFVIAWRTHTASTRQRRLENSFNMVELFHENLEPGDVDMWKEVFRGGYEGTGAKFGTFYLDGILHHFADLFTEGPPDNGAIPRIVDQFELVCQEVELGTIELRIIYSSLGQMMEHLIALLTNDSAADLSDAFPSFNRVMKQNRNRIEKWPYRTITYCE